ncbi:MAG TPA: hypothetical protein VEM41_09555 [Actinomycetota bacterium]|nr:hypothetical protein [Actinomycetota bacterium]
MEGNGGARGLRRWRGPLLGVGVLGVLFVAGATILTLFLLVAGVATLLTNFG